MTGLVVRWRSACETLPKITRSVRECRRSAVTMRSASTSSACITSSSVGLRPRLNWRVVTATVLPESVLEQGKRVLASLDLVDGVPCLDVDHFEMVVRADLRFEVVTDRFAGREPVRADDVCYHITLFHACANKDRRSRLLPVLLRVDVDGVGTVHVFYGEHR